MKVADTIFTIVCDDVREEVGNKPSLMGLYSQEMIVPAFPAALRTLNVVIFMEGLKKRFKKTRLAVQLPEAKPLSVEGGGTAQMPVNKNNVRMIFGFSPFVIEAEGVIIIELFIDNVKQPVIEHKIEIKLAKKSPEQ